LCEMLIMVTNRALYAFATKTLNILEWRQRTVRLNHADWQDFKQETLIHLFQKKDLIKDGMGYKGYVDRLVKNRFQNHIRNRCKNECHDEVTKRAKLSVLYPQPLLTKEVTEGLDGEKEIVYYPDIAPSTDNISPDSRERVNKIIDLLPAAEKDLLMTYDDSDSWDSAGKKLGLNAQTARKRYLKCVARIREELKNT